MWRSKKLIVIGGSGHLGQKIVKKFKTGGMGRKWKVFNIDLEENKEAHMNFIIDPTKSITEETVSKLHDEIKTFDDDEVEAIFNVAGLLYPPNTKKYMR